MDADWTKWALVAPNDDTGLGRMAQDLKVVLSIGRHFVTSTDRMPNRPLDSAREVPFDRSLPQHDLEDLLGGLQGIIFLERNDWHAALLPTARRLDVRTICVPMWEWFRGVSSRWRNCDFFACPNAQCLQVVRSYGYSNSALISWTLDLSRFPKRTISGRAQQFVHNAGLVDPDDRKGTADAVSAFSRVSGPGLRLTVRLQKPAQVSAESDPRVEFRVGNIPEPALLYAEGDAFIQPSRVEGMGFMVLEAVASGLPVITTDIRPLNEWVRDSRLLAHTRRFSYPAYSSAWIEHSHLRVPRIRDLARKIAWAADNDLAPISEANRQWAEVTFDPRILRTRWTELLNEVLRQSRQQTVMEEPEPEFPCHRIGHRLRSRISEMTGLRIPFRLTR